MDLVKRLKFIREDLIEDGVISNASAWAHTLDEAIAALQVGGEPVAWRYEYATVRKHGYYVGWTEAISTIRPDVPHDSIRNLTPLYAGRAPVAVTWQPIETAPRDWSSIMLYVPDDALNDKVVEGYWSDADGGDACWKTAGNDVVEPTMWQPKPAEPSAALAAEVG